MKLSSANFSAIIAGTNADGDGSAVVGIRHYMFFQNGIWWIRHDNRNQNDDLLLVNKMFINKSVV